MAEEIHSSNAADEMELSSSTMSPSNAARDKEHQSICLRCEDPAIYKCAGCKSVSFCSEVCQAWEWRVHKFICAPDSELLAPPCFHAVRALLFPVDGTTVRIIWLPWSVFRKNGQVLDMDTIRNFLHIPEIRKFSDVPELGSTIPRCENERGHAITFYYRKAFRTDGSLINRSANAVARGRGGQAKMEWRGPVIVSAGNSWTPGSVPKVYDITMADFRDVADGLSWLDFPVHVPSPYVQTIMDKYTKPPADQVVSQPSFELPIR